MRAANRARERNDVESNAASWGLEFDRGRLQPIAGEPLDRMDLDFAKRILVATRSLLNRFELSTFQDLLRCNGWLESSFYAVAFQDLGREVRTGKRFSFAARQLIQEETSAYEQGRPSVLDQLNEGNQSPVSRIIKKAECEFHSRALVSRAVREFVIPRCEGGSTNFPKSALLKWDLSGEQIRWIVKTWAAAAGRPMLFGSSHNPGIESLATLSQSRKIRRLPQWVSCCFARHLSSPSSAQTYLSPKLSKHKLTNAARALRVAGYALPLDIATRVGGFSSLWKRLAAITAFEQSRAIKGETRAEYRSKVWSRYNALIAEGPVQVCATYLHSRIEVGGSVARVVSALQGKAIGNDTSAPRRIAGALLDATADLMNCEDDRYGEALRHRSEFVCEIIRSIPVSAYKTACSELNVERGGWTTRGALGLALVFGKDCTKWIDKKTWGDAPPSLHDLVEWLPIAPAKQLEGLGAILLKLAKRQYFLDEIQGVAHNWTGMPEAVRKGTLEEIVRYALTSYYPGATAPLFAAEAARWHYPANQYAALERAWVRSQTVPEAFPLTSRWETGGLVGRFLPRSDPRGLFIGGHTNCCQHPLGAGSTSAWHGQNDVQGGFFVVEDESSEIVAASWVWRKPGKGTCFDSLEAKGLGERAEKVDRIYRQASQYLAEHFGEIVTGGSGFSETTAEAKQKPERLESPSGVYTDAGNQVLLADGRNFPAQRAPSIRREVVTRQLRADDRVQCSAIAEQVYPEGWQFVSEGDTGFSLEVEGKVVGYAIIDSEDREINDLAILPEFRRFGREFLQEVMGYCASRGGTWRAECRESTSLQLLRLLAKREVLQVREFEPSERMGEEQIVPVEFTFFGSEEQAEFITPQEFLTAAGDSSK